MKDANSSWGSYTAAPDDSPRMAAWKATQVTSRIKRPKKPEGKSVSSDPNQIELFKIPGRRLGNQDLVVQNLQRYSEKLGKGHVLTIGEALQAELERQSRSGVPSPVDALQNIRFYIADGGKLSIKMTPEEKKEIADAHRRARQMKKAHRKLVLSPRARVIYEIQAYVHARKQLRGHITHQALKLLTPTKMALEYGIMNAIRELKTEEREKRTQQ